LFPSNNAGATVEYQRLLLSNVALTLIKVESSYFLHVLSGRRVVQARYFHPCDL